MSVQDIIKVHPRPISLDRDLLLRCIDDCIDCSATCASCADADLGEADVKGLVRCVRLCLDCADLCDATARIVTRQTETDLGIVGATLEACLVACRACAEEYERHAAHHEHCRACAEVCRRCEVSCADLLGALG
jgi:hypothetical protein